MTLSEVDEGYQPCEGDHGSDVVPAAEYVGTMPDSDSPSALCYLCSTCLTIGGQEMVDEGWRFATLSPTAVERCAAHPPMRARWKSIDTGEAMCDLCTLKAVKAEHDRITAAIAAIPDLGGD